LLESHFWIDLRKQIAAAVLMQVLPYCDESCLKVLRGFEPEGLSASTQMADG